MTQVLIYVYRPRRLVIWAGRCWKRGRRPSGVWSYLTASSPASCGRRDARVTDDVYEEASRHFDEKTLVGLIMAIVAINAWNRIAITTRMAPSVQA